MGAIKVGLVKVAIPFDVYVIDIGYCTEVMAVLDFVLKSEPHVLINAFVSVGFVEASEGFSAPQWEQRFLVFNFLPELRAPALLGALTCNLENLYRFCDCVCHLSLVEFKLQGLLIEVFKGFVLRFVQKLAVFDGVNDPVSLVHSAFEKAAPAQLLLIKI